MVLRRVSYISGRLHVLDTHDTSSLSRGPDGRFKDDDLAKVLQDATERPAGAFGARGTPPVLRIIEVLGIEQARTWGICSVRDTPFSVIRY